MNIQEMMEKDPKSVIGYTVTIPSTVTGVIRYAVKRYYSWPVDGVNPNVTRYLVSFDGYHYYTVDRFVTGYKK